MKTSEMLTPLTLMTNGGEGVRFRSRRAVDPRDRPIGTVGCDRCGLDRDDYNKLPCALGGLVGERMSEGAPLVDSLGSHVRVLWA